MVEHLPPAPSTLTQQLKDRIVAHTGRPAELVFDGFVPDELPADMFGYVEPYVVLYSGLGTDLREERDLTRLADRSVTDWTCQTNCVGASVAIARDLAHDVSLGLNGFSIGAGWLKPDDDFFAVPEPIPDTQVSPARFVLPLRWRLTTN